jgi:hypothetical protein
MPIGKYRGITLQRELLNKIEEYIKAHPEMGYTSIAEFVKEAVREKCAELKILTPTSEQPELEHFNVCETGVRILDRSLSNGTSRGRIIDVYFKPNIIWCEYCKSDSCRHVEFALNIPKVRQILLEKDWPISEKVRSKQYYANY